MLYREYIIVFSISFERRRATQEAQVIGFKRRGPLTIVSVNDTEKTASFAPAHITSDFVEPETTTKTIKIVVRFSSVFKPDLFFVGVSEDSCSLKKVVAWSESPVD